MSVEQAIPFVDLKAQHSAIASEINEAIQEVIANTSFILGPDVADFEREFASFCEATYCVGVDSGMSALELGIRALGIGPGDEVITPANSFVASSSAVSLTGATPVWVDMLPGNYNLDPDLVEAAISPRTKAIMPVHLYGQMADMDPLLEIGSKHGIPVIEDACQAHGARYRGRRAGSMGAFAAFSFYPGKNLGAYGDAGAITTGDPDLAERVRSLRNYGQQRKYEHLIVAGNKRLDSIQAAVLRVKLRHLERWNRARRQLAELYDELLPPGALKPRTEPWAEHVWHLYVVQVEDRDRVQATLQAEGISTGIHYPLPIHLQACYAGRGLGRGSFPVTESAAPRLLSLPMFAELGEGGVRRVTTALARALSTG